ncbi:MAG: NAD(+) diphosphatase [Treponema sp.]|nr:NAD(+) diphosphatase [Treponema sp.]
MMDKRAFQNLEESLLSPVDFSDSHVKEVRQLLAEYSVEGRGIEGLERLKDLGGILRACHIAQWKRDSRFCGSCGALNDDAPFCCDNNLQTHRICHKCGRMEFPRICPAVIVLITDADNRILLAHNKRFKESVYSHISGFTEAGETLEETAAREIREEINIEVKDIEYIKSQPWPFPNSLMVGFKAHYSSGTIKPDGEEIEDAKWFTKDALPELPGNGSLSRFLINDWLAGKL